MANAVQGLVEFDEQLRRSVNKEAFVNRIKMRLATPMGSVAYYPFGLDLATFELLKGEGSVSTLDVRDAIRDIVQDPSIITEGGRVSIITTDVEVVV